MSGIKGKSGGLREGAGRPCSTITLRDGDQFYTPMRGLATVVSVGRGWFEVDIEGDVIKFMDRSRANGKRVGAPRKAKQGASNG